MRNDYFRYFVGFLVAIGLIILVVFLLFHGSSNSGKTATSTPKPLSSYASTDTIAKLTIDGPVNAPQNHSQIQITVGRDEATYQQYQGYDGTIVKAQSYPNTQNSYTTFLHSLAVAGFTLGNSDPKLANSAGYCSRGDVYTFELIQDGQTIEHFWSNSCGTPKTFKGNQSLTLTLFQSQIPDYNALLTNITL